MNWQKKKIQASREFQIKAYDEVNDIVFTKRKGKQLVQDNGNILTEFISCSYLGLDMDRRIISGSSKNLLESGVTFPAARTRARSKRFIMLERLLNKIFCHGYSTIFSSVHMGHLGVIPMLGSGELPSFPIKPDGIVFLVDKTAHSSIQINRALMSQFGAVEIVDFENHDDLENQFKSSFNRNMTPLAIGDSIGSMGGIAPVSLLLQLAEKYGGYVFFDDAHGTSLYGKHGCGYVLSRLQCCFHRRLILASSLSKAFGSVAGVIVLPTAQDAAMMQQFSPTYIFGGPPILAAVDAAIESARIHLSDEIYSLQKKLQSNLDYFDCLFKNYPKVVNVNSISPIRGLYVGDEHEAIHFSKSLRERGFALTTAMYPTVAKGQSILRAALSAAHKKHDIKRLFEAIVSISSNIAHLDKRVIK